MAIKIEDKPTSWYERLSGALKSAFTVSRPEGWEVFDKYPDGSLTGGSPDMFMALSPGGEDSTAVRRFIGSDAKLEGMRSRNASSQKDLDAVNAAVNRTVRYSGAEDVGNRWLPPRETLEGGRGDCEDYAILKYHVLRDMGVPPKDMALLIYKDANGVNAHAALGVRMNGRAFVLDIGQGEALRMEDYNDAKRMNDGLVLGYSVDAQHNYRTIEPRTQGPVPAPALSSPARAYQPGG